MSKKSSVSSTAFTRHVDHAMLCDILRYLGSECIVLDQVDSVMAKKFGFRNSISMRDALRAVHDTNLVIPSREGKYLIFSRSVVESTYFVPDVEDPAERALLIAERIQEIAAGFHVSAFAAVADASLTDLQRFLINAKSEEDEFVFRAYGRSLINLYFCLCCHSSAEGAHLLNVIRAYYYGDLYCMTSLVLMILIQNGVLTFVSDTHVTFDRYLLFDVIDVLVPDEYLERVRRLQNEIGSQFEMLQSMQASDKVLAKHRATVSKLKDDWDVASCNHSSLFQDLVDEQRQLEQTIEDLTRQLETARDRKSTVESDITHLQRASNFQHEVYRKSVKALKDLEQESARSVPLDPEIKSVFFECGLMESPELDEEVCAFFDASPSSQSEMRRYSQRVRNMAACYMRAFEVFNALREDKKRGSPDLADKVVDLSLARGRLESEISGVLRKWFPE